MEVLVLEIEDPGCFWIAMKGCGPYIVDEIEYKTLNAEMNQFYEKSYQDVDEVKPLAVEEGQICVVFSEELKCWCRAVVKSVMYCMDHYQTKCFLVDYAKYIFVKSKESDKHMDLKSLLDKVSCLLLEVSTKSIRVALEAFTQIPYRAKKCRLYCTKPVTLHIDFCEDTAKMVPAKRWDSAATQYFQNLLKASTQVKAKLCAVEDNTFDVFLYVTIKDEKVCINDDLVAKNFAFFEEAKENRTSANYQENKTTLNTESFPVKVNPALAFRPAWLREKVPTTFETGLTVFSSFLEASCQSLSMDLNENTASSFQNLSDERNFVFLSKKIEPSSFLETAPLHDDLKEELTQKKFLGPSLTESYCWPPVARGCDVVAISDQGNDPFIYIPPVLSILQLGSCYKALPNKNGPLVLILCPGWKKAQLVFELLQTYKRCSRQLHPMLVILGQNKEGRHVKIQGCGVIVTTPYSLLRLFEHHHLLFFRLCHLVLDEVEVLFSDAAEQVLTILNCYKKAIVTEKREYSPRQIIAVGTHWNKHIAQLIKEFMNDPYIVITAMEEASIYGNVQQVVQPCTKSERTAVLLKILDFTHENFQKVLVFTDSVNEADMVHKALECHPVFSLKLHKESKFNFKYILEQWKKKCSSGTPVVLDDCMQSLGITDATCVIHFSFPSPRIFGQRLHSLSDNFCNVIKDSSVDQEYTKARSVILLTENSACHALGILRYLQRAEAEIPVELRDFAAKLLKAEEDKKFSRPLCAYLKTFGVCKNRTTCPDRHQINLQIDMAQSITDKITKMPGCVTVLPLDIVNATNYFGRIVDKQNDQYTILAEEINEYFKKPGNKVAVKNVEKLAVYGLCEETLFHRVQVVEIPTKEEENLFFNVKIKYIDEGRTHQVQSYRLLHLPAKFQCLPPQAVEFVICRVKPIDNEIEWNPEVNKYIQHKIKGKLHEAKIVHTLGNTAWLDPMVRVTRFSDLKISVNEYNVRSEILSMGLGADNPEHIIQLQKLCGHIKEDQAESLKPLSVKEDTAGPENVSNLQFVSIQENSTGNSNSSKIIFGNQLCDGVALMMEAEDTTLHQHKCFYPEVKWFQNEESLTVKVKLASVADYKCEFSKEKVVFSAWSGGKLYVADMELHQCILEEKSTCVIKDREVIIALTKERKGPWCKLLKNKNPQVSFDFEHWEEFEDKSPFPVGNKKLCYTAAGAEELVEAVEDNGTESDE